MVNTTLTVGSLCTGIGGLEHGLTLAGLDTHPVFVSDIDPGACAWLEANSTAPNLGDFTSDETWRRLVGMDKRRNDEKAEQMYARYRAGLSLEQVGNEFGITRQSVYKSFKCRGWDMRPRPPIGEYLEYGGKRYTMRNTGYFGCTTGDRHLLHRRVWADYHGDIPPGYDIHHVDGDRTNNEITNLHLIEHAAHARLHAQIESGGDAHEPHGVDILTAGFP